MFSLDDARLFAKVVEFGGFTAAAGATGHPKSTLSKRVAALENQLGVRLLHRNTRGLSLSEAGRDFNHHIGAMLIEAETAAAGVLGQLAEPQGDVRLTASVITARYHLSAILPLIAGELPRVRIVLQATDRMVDMIQEGFDIAIRDHHTPLPSSDLVQRRIGHEPDLLAASPDYLVQSRTPKTADELASHDGLMNGSSTGPWSWHLTNGAGTTCILAPMVRLVADDPETVLQAALNGLGIAALPRSICAGHIKAGKLVHLLPAWSPGGATTTLLTPHRRGQLPSVRAVADRLVARLRERLDAL